MICVKCNKSRQPNKFQTVMRNGIAYKRKDCRDCRNKQDHQVRLKKLMLKGEASIKRCKCGKLFRNRLAIDCYECRGIYSRKLSKSKIKENYDELLSKLSDEKQAHLNKANKLKIAGYMSQYRQEKSYASLVQARIDNVMKYYRKVFNGKN